MFRKTNDEALDKEQGRSMIEMIGVLAIVGILSIGSIGGYTFAMRKVRTNNLQDAVVAAAEFVKSYDMAGFHDMEKMPLPENALDRLGSASASIDMMYNTVEVVAEQESKFYISLSGVPASLCQSVAMLEWGMEGCDALLIMDDSDGDPAIIPAFSEGNHMTFTTEMNSKSLSVEQLNFIKTKCETGESQGYKKFRFRFMGYTKSAA